MSESATSPQISGIPAMDPLLRQYYVVASIDCTRRIVAHSLERHSSGAQVEHAVRRQMDNEVGPDQLVVVLDAQGASALQVTRKAQLCKDTAVTLNKVLPSLPLAQTSQGLPLTSSHFLEQGSPFECFDSALAA